MTLDKTFKAFYTPPHDSDGLLWFHVGHLCVYIHWSVVCPSIQPAHFSFRDVNLSKLQWILSNNGMCIDIMKIWAQLFKTNDVVS